MDLCILTQGLRFGAVNILSVRKSVEIAPIFYFPPFSWQPGPGTPQYSFLLLPYVFNLNIYYDIYLFEDKEMYFVRYL